jgi:AraC family transcriptional regulator of arabinose operon
MDETTLGMDKSTSGDREVYRSEQFRIPSQAERTLGLWVDRIGEGVSDRPLDRLRILGQFCHVIILNGHGVYISERYGTHEVLAGDCMVQFPEDPCVYYPYGAWTTRWVTWNGPEARQLEKLGFLAKTTPVFRDTGMSISRAYNQLLPIMQRGDPAAALRRKALVLQMVVALQDTQQQLAGEPQGHPRIEQALALLHDRFNRDIPIPELAREVGLSPTHFRRQFLAYTGRTPVAYIRDLRMAEAQRLLREGMPIKQVADAVGYQDPFYFMRVFRTTVGSPPGSFARTFGGARR